MFSLSLLSSSQETLIIPLGLLQELNHNATGTAFIKLAQEPNRQLEDEKLDGAKLAKVMPQILVFDAKFRSGKCDAKQFRTDVLELLKLKATDEEFDLAWNAMQGNITKLSVQLQEIKKQNPKLNLVFISKTNPIHLKNIYQSIQPEIKLDAEKNDSSLSILNMPLHVSYQCPDYKETSSDKALYVEAINKNKLDFRQTSIILQCTSNSPYAPVKKRDEESAAGIKQWAESQGLYVIDRKPQENIIDSITRGLYERNEFLKSAKIKKDAQQTLSYSLFNPGVQLTGFGSKQPSGTPQLWSFNDAEEKTTNHQDEIRPNRSYWQ